MGRKHWEKEKLLVTSNFYFSHSVLKRHVLQTCKNQGLFGKGLKEFVDDNYKMDKDGRFSKRVENTVGKIEIACYEQFLLFSQCFQKTVTGTTDT